MRNSTARFLLVVIGTLFSSAHSFAQTPSANAESFWWDHPELVTVSEQEMAFTDKNFAAAKNDSIYIMVYFNDGWVLMFSWFHVKTAVFDRWGMYALIADPQGRSYWITHQPDADSVRFKSDRLYISDGTSILQGSNMEHTLKARFGEFACDLNFDSLLPPWKPGTGKLEYTQSGDYYQRKVVNVPWAVVRGTLEVENRKIVVEGQGYIEKTLFVNPFTRFHSLINSIRVYSELDEPESERWHINILDYTLGPAYDHRPVRRLTVAKGSAWVFTTQDHRLEPIGLESPEYVPYEYPTAVRIRYAGENGYSLFGVYRSTHLFNFTDVFDELPPWLKHVLIVFMKRPVYFRMMGEFHGTLVEPDGTVHRLHLRGPYEYVVSQ